MYMKILKTLFCTASAVLLFTGCKSLSGTSSVGKPYELLVVLSDNQWNGRLGDSVRSVLTDTIVRYYQPEPFFDLYRTNAAGFRGRIRNYRNVVIFDLSPDYAEVKDTLRRNTYTSPQTVYTVYAPTGEAAAKFIGENRRTVQGIFLDSERDFQISRAQKMHNPLLEAEVKNMFGIDMTIPSGYRIRNKGEGILWISYDTRLVSQGFIIYTSPVPDENSADRPVSELRDRYVKFVPGPSDGSYMITSPHIPIEMEREEINGHPWAVMHGFWDIQGDFMGGPFTNYTTYYPERDKLISIDAYVYSPDPVKGKRDYIRELENLAHSVKLTGDEADGPVPLDK